ncbi:ribonuclease HII [Bacillus massiliglaciei]|uniref:ribonuclease HII n=1 Tax=Bacillus massiliglaciei TaxID=1816693 RepID=UPI000DA62AF6|nr:ribonuclease HII [Bacillus massiliglaciei]
MNKLSIKEISRVLKSVQDPFDPFLIQCSEDGRKGVQDLADKWKRHYERRQKVLQEFERMSSFEKELKQKGFTFIAGIDEVGRGPLAGPVVASAVILPDGFLLPGLNDSKKVPEKTRERFYETIMKEAVSVGTGIIHSDEIDEINIYQAAKKAMLQAVSKLSIMPDHLLIDAMELDLSIPQLSIIKGDSKSISISAASIVAKVTRDRIMREYAEQHPHYHFEQNMGYGTPAHLEALDLFGLTPWHRKSFSPVKERLLPSK